MQELLQELKEARKENDLFAFWEKELKLRSNLRYQNRNDFPLWENGEDFLFWQRALYYSHNKNLFLETLFVNVNNYLIIQALLNYPKTLLKDFLKFIPDYISNQEIDPSKLSFLINIFQVEYLEEFKEICDTLDIDSCKFLLSRTGNPLMKKLLKARELQIQDKLKNEHYGFFQSEDTFHTIKSIYGDKVQLCKNALKLGDKCENLNSKAPYSLEHFLCRLDLSDELYALGLLEDNIALLLAIYKDYQSNFHLNLDKIICNRINIILNISIPVYAYTTSPQNASSMAQNLFTNYFKDFSLDKTTYEFLLLYEYIIAQREYDMLMKSKNLLELRPQDDLLKQLCNCLSTPFSHENYIKLGVLSSDKITSSPMETFICNELIRQKYLLEEKKMTNKLAEMLLSNYFILWRWLPSPIHLNEDIILAIAPYCRSKIRQEPEKRIQLIREDLDKIYNDFHHKNELFKKSENLAQLEIIVAKIMGVIP